MAHITVDAIRAEMERVDAVRKVMKALRDEVVERVRDETDRQAILAKIAVVEGMVRVCLLVDDGLLTLQTLFPAAQESC